jgi:hypothetical protein
MSELWPDHEAFRQALHTAADQLEPAADGLQRIKARVSHRRPMPLPIAWVDVALTRLSLRIPDGVWTAWDRVEVQLKGALARYLPASARALSGRLRLGWMRPVAAMSVVAFIVAAVVYMAIDVPQALYPTGIVSSTGHGHKGPGNPTGAAPGQSLTTGGSKTSPGQNPTSGATDHTTCATKNPTITPHPSTKTSTSSPSQSTSPSPSSSTSTSTSPTPTPSDSSTGSTAPSGTGDSPQLGPDGDSGPSDSPSSGTTSQRAAITASRVLGTSAKPIHHKKTSKPAATPSPSCSGKAGSSPTSTVSVNPDAAGGLFLIVGLPGETSAEAGGRVS